MLIGIPPLLGPDLLATLRGMGHGDEIAIVDGNYPAQGHARRLIRADGHGLLDVLDAILAVLPLDRSVPQAVLRASWMNDPAQSAPIHGQIDDLVRARAPDCGLAALSGAEIYDRIRAAHAIVATSEPELYANVILRKGAITPAERSGLPVRA